MKVQEVISFFDKMETLQVHTWFGAIENTLQTIYYSAPYKSLTASREPLRQTERSCRYIQHEYDSPAERGISKISSIRLSNPSNLGACKNVTNQIAKQLTFPAETESPVMIIMSLNALMTIEHIEKDEPA